MFVLRRTDVQMTSFNRLEKAPHLSVFNMLKAGYRIEAVIPNSVPGAAPNIVWRRRRWIWQRP
jgi:hypothetical protein